jgi:Na+/H+ antiporter NhaA
MLTLTIALLHVTAAIPSLAGQAADHAAALLPLASGDGNLNTPGIVAWIKRNIVSLFLMVIGLYILSKAMKGSMSSVLNITVIAVIGLIFIGGGAAILAFGEGLSKVFFGG